MGVGKGGFIKGDQSDGVYEYTNGTISIYKDGKVIKKIEKDSAEYDKIKNDSNEKNEPEDDTEEQELSDEEKTEIKNVAKNIVNNAKCMKVINDTFKKLGINKKDKEIYLKHLENGNFSKYHKIKEKPNIVSFHLTKSAG
jgi:hypothetical protein